MLCKLNHIYANYTDGFLPADSKKIVKGYPWNYTLWNWSLYNYTCNYILFKYGSL